MKKIVFGLLAAVTLGSAALPAAAQGIVVRENRHGNVVVRPAGAYEHRYDRHYRGGYHRHRHVRFDRFGHRHMEWR